MNHYAMPGSGRINPAWVNFWILAVFCLSSFSSAAATDKLQVYVVNYPLAYFAERIGGDQVDVQFAAPAGIDPAFWMPDTETIAAYQQADLILLNGADYAQWLTKVSLPQRKLVNTSSLFSQDYITTRDDVTHQHGPGGEHSHTGIAFTTWLDFSQAAMQAEQVAMAIKKLRPAHAEVFTENYQRLQRDLLQLDAQMREITSGKPEFPLLASHPVYQYLARRYGLNLRAVMWEPDTYPDAASWRAFKSLQEVHPARWMLWEDEPMARTRNSLSQSDVKTVVFKPCMNRPARGDFLTVMQANISLLDELFKRPY
ncbi:MAG: metal ABC transporter substrate-binding protein [Gammaproteobacteria bacterium]|nr:metal ABC transporter substrate-binding protein [Gammaproteobacteria bacterium]